LFDFYDAQMHHTLVSVPSAAPVPPLPPVFALGGRRRRTVAFANAAAAYGYYTLHFHFPRRRCGSRINNAALCFAQHPYAANVFLYARGRLSDRWVRF